MNHTKLREFILSELTLKRPDIKDPEKIADFILGQPSLQTMAGVQGFLKGYLNGR